MVEAKPASQATTPLDVRDNRCALKVADKNPSSCQNHDTPTTMEDSSLDTYHSIHDNHPLVGTGHGSFPERPRSPLYDKASLSQCRTSKDILSALYGAPMAFFTAKPMQSESSLAIGYHQKALHDTVDVQPQSQPLREPSKQSTRDTIQASTMKLKFRTPPSNRSTLGTVNAKL
jgi:hypothetical protein